MQTSNGYIEESFSDSTIIGNEAVGGILGVGEGLVENCFTQGSLNTNYEGSFCGGLVGVVYQFQNDSGEYFLIDNCYSLMNIDAEYGGGNNIDSLIGDIEEESLTFSFYNLFYEFPGYDSYSKYGNEKTQAELQISSTYWNWTDFDDYWVFPGSNSYPQLKWEYSSSD